MGLWKQLPHDTVWREIMRQGGAFRMPHRFGAEESKNRFFFVLNREPTRDSRVYVVTATTQIEKRRSIRSPDVLVALDPHDYPPLSAPSLVDCESLTPFTTREISDAIARHEVQPLEAVPRTVLDRMLQAIERSRTIAQSIKRLILPDEKP